jgi:hypothetical protein
MRTSMLKLHHTTVLAALTAFGCQRSSAPLPDRVTVSTVAVPTDVSTTMDTAVSHPLAGTYGMIAAAGPTQRLTIDRDGNYTVANSGSPMMADLPAPRGRVTLEDKRVSFHPVQGTTGPFNSTTLTLREHQGRRVLLPDDQLDAFELLPTWRLGLVELREGENPSSVRAPLEVQNPKDRIENESLPTHFEAHIELYGTPSGQTLHLQVQAIPHNISVSGCVAPNRSAPCRPNVGSSRTLGPAAWAEANRLYLAIHHRTTLCEPLARPRSAPRYHLRWQGGGMEGQLPERPDPTILAHSCEVESRFVYWFVEQWNRVNVR